MFIREQCACGSKVEADDDDRQDCQRAVNTWRKLHTCGVRIAYYQSEHHAETVARMNGQVEIEGEEESIPTT